MVWYVGNQLSCHPAFGLQASVEVSHVLECRPPENFRFPEVIGDAHLIQALSVARVEDVDGAVVDKIYTICLLVILVLVE